jgi:hypothetical protein
MFSRSKRLWKEVEEALYSTEFEKALWEKLLMRDKWQFRDFRVQSDMRGFAIGAHPDISKKLATLMFYLPTGTEVRAPPYLRRSSAPPPHFAIAAATSLRCCIRPSAITHLYARCRRPGERDTGIHRGSRRRRRGATARVCTRWSSSRRRAPQTARRSAR